MIKEKLLKLYKPFIIIIALVLRLVFVTPLIITLWYVYADNIIYSTSLESFVLNSQMYHILLLLLSIVIIPILIYSLIKEKCKSRKLKFFCYFILYYLIINIFIILVESYYIAVNKLGS
jgi:hypothetical protein